MITDKSVGVIGTPAKCSMEVLELDYYSSKYAYKLKITLTPTALAKLDTQYVLEISSPYLDYSTTIPFSWHSDMGFKAITNTMIIRRDAPLSEHISILQYREAIQIIGGATLKDAEDEFYREFKKLIKIRVIKDEG